jgi:hypothetical protein
MTILPGLDGTAEMFAPARRCHPWMSGNEQGHFVFEVLVHADARCTGSRGCQLAWFN